LLNDLKILNLIHLICQRLWEKSTRD